jgi:general secretion pathway protein E
MKLGDILVAEGRLTANQLDDTLAGLVGDPTTEQLEAALVGAGLVSPRDFLSALGKAYHLQSLDRITDDMIDSTLVDRVPVDWARRNRIIPIRHLGEFYAAMSSPDGLPRMEELALLLGEELSGILAPEAEVKRAIDQAYFERKRDAAPKDSSPSAPPPAIIERADDLLRMSDSAPVTQLLNSLLLDAVRKQASDVHIEPYENHLRIRFRMDGYLYEQPAPPKNLEQALISRIKVMSKLDIAERRLPQDGMAKVRAGEREIDIRVSTVPVAEGERVVLRLLNQASTLLPLTALGMPAEVLRGFKQAMALPNGIILVTGPTGSGKTTTLYAALREVDTAHRNVLTIEDPIEYQMPDIGQIQVKPKIGLTFAAGLRHILRQDPDVILVGEIRDQETAEIAVRAALTGHLVFSTLHTNDAVSALTRLADMGVAPYLIGSSVRAIVAQRLVRRLCPLCRVPTALDASDIAALPAAFRAASLGQVAYRPAGCPSCMQGYKGRIGLYELFTLGPGEQEQIRRGLESAQVRHMAAAQNSLMWTDALAKIADGITSLEETLRVIEPAPAVSSP